MKKYLNGEELNSFKDRQTENPIIEESKTSLSMAKQNKKMQCRKLERLLKLNFTENDYFITLCFSDEMPINEKKEKENVSYFIRQLRNAYKPHGDELKYIKFSCCIKENKPLHFLIINCQSVSPLTITRLWAAFSPHINIQPLKSGATAELLISANKRAVGQYHKCYIPSQNLITE